MEIKPGIGLGSIRFGFEEGLVTRMLGKPDRVEEAEFVERSGDWYRELSFGHLSASFRFDKEDDFKLGNITIDGRGHTLFGGDLHGRSRAFVIRFLGAGANELPQLVDRDLDIDYECLSYKRMGVMLFFHDGCLDEIQYGYLFEPDDNTAIWPK
ncbi:MAG: hypothetical protein OEZ06_18155 [Myxococcales bacterium]|nr:hypothetical protein [Myxococcales bacterium]